MPAARTPGASDKAADRRATEDNAGAAVVRNLEGFGLGNAATIRGRPAGYDQALYRLQETEALVAARVVEAAQTSGARYAALDPAQEAVRQALEMYRKFRDVSFATLWPKVQIQFDALETLTAVQALNQARVLYLQQVIEFNRSQFRLYTALGRRSAASTRRSRSRRRCRWSPKSMPTPVLPPRPVP